MSRKPKRLCPFPECLDCNQTDQNTSLHSINQSSQTDALTSASQTTGGTNLSPNWLDVWTNEEMVQLQQQDLCIGEIMRLKELSENKPPRSEILQIHKDIITL